MDGGVEPDEACSRVCCCLGKKGSRVCVKNKCVSKNGAVPRKRVMRVRRRKKETECRVVDAIVVGRKGEHTLCVKNRLV